ncbi:MAG: hypothetical protein SA378_11595 [Sedimentibacter sp.]|uniref:hypothetical protein n=1 Tax=Sedimentibacter sp. TaxID=1960295 RepID=UPI00298291AE|nr:hypothetical protein [Sedimentibacter sp.]MDW5300759.1 hypothetical protein [Sedimentibacter sp.]
MISIEIFSFFGKIVTNATDAEKDIKGVTNTAKDSEGKMTKTFANIGKAVITAFSVKAIVDFCKKLIESSANIQAMEAQFDQVFKSDNAQAVEGIAKQVDDLGIHADRLTVSWNKFGGQVKGAGMDGQQALDAVDKATRLAADSAAFYDTSLENASGSIASFMKGNFEAGDAIGVFTNAKQMDVKSNEMYGKSWADLTESERQWLLLDTVEKTYEMNGAMGQATRESGAYENTMGNLKATFERFYSVVGAPVLDGFLVVVGKVTDGVMWLTEKVQTLDWSRFQQGYDAAVEYLQPVIDTAQRLGDTVLGIWENTLRPFIADFVEMLKELYEENKDKIDLVIELFNAFASFLEDRIFPLIVGWYELVRDNFDKIKNTIRSVLDVISGIIKVFIGIFTADWETMKEGLIEIWNGLWTGIYNIVSGAWKILSGAFDIVWDAIEGWFDDLVADGTGWGGNLVLGLWNGISSLAGWIKDKVYGFVEGIGKTITEFFGIESPSKLMALYGRYIDEGLAKGIDDNASKPTSSMNSVAEAISNALKKVSDFVTNTSNIIQKEFELWKLQNEELQGSSQELEMQLAAQQEQLGLLTEQIRITETALADIVAQYGESSDQALNYKNQLLDLQIEQAKLTGSIDDTTQALNGMAQIQARISSYDNLSESEKMSNRSQGKKEKDNYYGTFKDDIDAISKRQGVDLGVAQEMHRENLISGIPKYANGTNYHPGGLAWVGDDDKELVSLPRGTQVFNEQQLGNLINQRPVELHLHIGNYIGDDYSLKKLGQKIRQIIMDENERLGVNPI